MWFLRPLLADIVQTEDVKELCKILIVFSREIANVVSGTFLITSDTFAIDRQSPYNFLSTRINVQYFAQSCFISH